MHNKYLPERIAAGIVRVGWIATPNREKRLMMGMGLAEIAIVGGVIFGGIALVAIIAFAFLNGTKNRPPK